MNTHTEEGAAGIATHEQRLAVLDDVLSAHAEHLRAQVARLGGVVELAQEARQIRESALGGQLTQLLAYLEQRETTRQEREQSTATLQDVLTALYGRPYLLPEQEHTPFGAFVNAVRVKGVKLPEVLNVSETLQYLNQQAGKTKYFLHDIYTFIATGRLWPLRVQAHPRSRVRRRYLLRQVAALSEALQGERAQPPEQEEKEE